jgi:predicted dehydrogenase
MMKRRQFLSAAASGPFLGRVLGANDRISIAQIGLGARGYYELSLCLKNPGVDIAGVCDVYEPFVRQAAQKVGGHVQGYTDFRRVLDRKDIDGVFVSTPDHWHAIISILACQAGKDVYCEKPLSHTIAEGRRMVEAARKYGRVVQTGSQQRSAPHFAEAQRLVQGGYIGKVSRVECWNFANQYPEGCGNPPDEDPPPGLNWDFYLGPAPQAHYNRNRFIWHYRWFWEYSGGMMTDWGAHHLDSTHQIMGVDAPLAVSACGGKFVLHDNRETPDTFRAVFEYPGFMVSYTNDIVNRYPKTGRTYGMMFCGTLGTLIIDRKSYEVIPEKSLGPGAVGLDAVLKNRGISLPKQAPEAGTLAPPNFSAPISVSGISLDPQVQKAHIQNWLDCIRSRKKAVADWETGHRSVTACHLGNIAFRTGRRIQWDAKSEMIPNDSEAARMMTKKYRAPWNLPAV